MPAAAELGISREAIARAEIMGRRTHEAITSMATSLLAIPEFSDALGRAFFSRAHYGHVNYGNEIPFVYFQRGGFGYLVGWDSSRYGPGLHGQPERHLDLIRSGLRITKYDPHEKTGDWEKKVAKLALETDFMVDKEDEILRFVKGSAEIKQGYDLDSSWEDPKSWSTADSKIKTSQESVFDKIPEEFGNLFPPAPVRI